MARQKSTAEGLDLKALVEEQEDLLRVLVQKVVQQVLEVEMEEALQAGKSERTEGRLGYRSGYYSRTLLTRVGRLELRVPQDREGRFSTQIFERYTAQRGAGVCARGFAEGQTDHPALLRALPEECPGPPAAQGRRRLSEGTALDL